MRGRCLYLARWILLAFVVISTTTMGMASPEFHPEGTGVHMPHPARIMQLPADMLAKAVMPTATGGACCACFDQTVRADDLENRPAVQMRLGCTAQLPAGLVLSPPSDPPRI